MTDPMRSPAAPGSLHSGSPTRAASGRAAEPAAPVERSQEPRNASTREGLLASPRVSIGLPVYNGEAYLAQTLDDFLAQTLTDFELLVCDNASTDRTAEIARRYAARDSRIRYVCNERNIGSLPNFNRSFRLTSPAHYFAWAAYDDRHTPDFLERLVALLDADKSASLAYGRSAIIDGDGRALPYDNTLRAFVAPDGLVYQDDRAIEQDIVGLPADRFETVLLSTMLNTPIHGLFRRSVLETSSLHQFYGSDTLLLAEAALAGPFRFLDAEVFQWRLHAGGTAYMTREEWAKRETGIEGFRPRLPMKSLPRYIRAVARAKLSAHQSARAFGAVARYLVRTDKLHRVFVPGPHNYLGIQRWPWRPRPEPAAQVAAHVLNGVGSGAGVDSAHSTGSSHHAHGVAGRAAVP